MGFSTALQGRSSHEVLVVLQDAEIRLLENIKRCLQLRIKSDREYAMSLNNVCMQAMKLDKNDELLSGSLVGKSWRVIVDEMEEMSKLVRHNADHLATHTMEKMNSLISDKRASRKMYVDERIRLETELAQFQETVNRTKVEYERCLENFKSAKTKYEEQFLKGKSVRKLDEVKDRYVRTSRKLHLVHNDYVLLLCSAAQYERDFRTVLLPGLLDFHQTVQEELILQLKIMMTELAQYTDMSSPRQQAIQQRILESIQDIMPNMEYEDFIERHKSNPPVPIAFVFDHQLIHDYTGKLKPNQVTVDSFTYDGLRAKLKSMDQALTQIRSGIKDRETQLMQCETELTTIRRSPETALLILVKKRAADMLRRELAVLQCEEEKLAKQSEMVRIPLASVGEEGPPQGVDIVDDSDDFVQTQCSPRASLTRLQSKRLVQLLKKPFVRKQDSVTGPSLPSKDFDDTSLNGHSSCSDPSVTPSLSIIGNLLEEEWFHGVLPRDEVIRLLTREGDYLVRETIRNEERQLVLSVCWQGHKHFIIQTNSEGQYRFEGPSFGTIPELISYQHKSGLPITSKSRAILKCPIQKERWELNNDDVELVTKIGRGNFGDVYRAKLISTGQEVAAKTCRMNLPDEQKRKFLQEGRILKQYDHPNIVKFIGICVQKQPIMIVMELVPGGSLLAYLRSNGTTLSRNQLLTMCVDTASGMAYLESKNCIHRDLAARNCLIGYENQVKISDFGMSREEEEYIVSDGMKQIPIKWTAPEALNFGKYTVMCDIWSFGVLMWEVFSLGSVPYSGMSNTKAREVIDSGYRMPPPDGTPDVAHKLMLRCWEYEPEKRPHFPEILSVLKDLSLALRQENKN